MSAYDCKELVNIMLEAYGLLAQSSRNVPEKVDKWIKLNNKNLRHLRLLLQSAASAPEKQKFLSTIAFLKGFKDKLKCLLKRGEGVRERRSDRVKWQDLEVAFNGRMRSGVITNLKQLDVAAFMKDCQVLFQSRIKTALKKETAVKVYAILAAEYVNIKADKEITEIKYFNTKSESIFQNTNLQQWFTSNVQQPIQRDIEEFQERDSGWTLRAILNLCVHINKYNAMRGSSYVELPDIIKRKEACVNVKNFDDACFKWALLSALHPAKKHSDRVSSYKAYENDPIFKDLQYRVLPKHIPKFEKQSDISVNVYTLKKMEEHSKLYQRI